MGALEWLARFKHDTVDILLLYCIRLFITIVLARGVLVGRPNFSKISCPFMACSHC